MQRRAMWILGSATLVAAAGWLAFQTMSAPVLDAYQVVAQPLVQTGGHGPDHGALARAGGQPHHRRGGAARARGDQVRAGDVLALLRADDLQAECARHARPGRAAESTRPQAQLAVQQTQRQWQQALRELERRRVLAAQQAITHEELEQAEQAEILARTAAEQAQLQARALQPGKGQEAVAQARVASAQALLDKATIRAEFAGTVLTRNAEPGDLVQPGQTLFEIARDTDTEVLVALDEKNLEVLALGQTAQCVADAYPRQPFAAQVSQIAPSIDPQRGTVDVRLRVAEPPTFLRQDMTVSVNIQTGQQEQAVVVPNDALTSPDSLHPIVWVVEQDRAVRRHALGLRGMAQIRRPACGPATGAGRCPGRAEPASACVCASARCRGNSHERPARFMANNLKRGGTRHD